MNLTVLNQTGLAVTVGWTPVPGCAGYVFYRDGVRVSNTWNPTRSQVKFALDGNPHTFKVEAVAAVDSGTIQIGAPTPIPQPQPAPSWAAYWDRQPAQVNITRPTVKVASQSALLQAITATPGGELIQYTGGKDLTGELTVQRYGPLSVVDLMGAKLTGTPAGSQLPNFFLKKTGGIRFINFEIAGGGGDGLRIEDAQGQLEFWGFKIHDTAAQGIHLYGVSRPCDGVVLHGEVYDCGLDLNQDPHAEKGTGLHGFYSGGSGQPVTNGDWTLWVHDQPHGAAMQIDRTRNTRIAELAENITFVAHQQVGGNALQLWAYGETAAAWNDNITVDYVEAHNVARVVETNGMEVGSLANSTVVYGRGSNVRLSPAYATRGGMRYQDVLPKP